MEQIKVCLDTIQYGNATINVAVDIFDPEKFYVTFSSVETILDYSPNSLKEKIDSESLKAFLGNENHLVQKLGFIVNKKAGNQFVSLLKFEDLVKLVTWEACDNQNPRSMALLVEGFVGSFRFLAYGQMGIRMEIQDRIDLISKYNCN